MRHMLWLCACLALANAACKSSPVNPTGLPAVARTNEINNLALRLDRGDWMVNQGSRTWKVQASSAPNRPPRHIGYLQERLYRQARGGPEFSMYIVTTLNRKEQIGHIDQLGQAIRYEPQRNGTFQQKAVGNNSRALNVAAIFDTNAKITFHEVSERRLAFEAIDVSGDGLLQANEIRNLGSRIAEADANGDGVIDFEEFAVLDIL